MWDVVWTKGKRYAGKLPFLARVKWGCERCRLGQRENDMSASRRFRRERNGVVWDVVWTKGKRYVGKLPFLARVKWGCERCRLGQRENDMSASRRFWRERSGGVG